jgi:opine dehydrogenase
MRLLEKTGQKGFSIQDAFEALYQAYSIGKPTLTETLRQSPIHGDPSMPSPSTLDTRYLTEDLPFGLVPWASIGRTWGMPTPMMDAMIHTASVMLDRDFFSEGIKVEDLGSEAKSPQELADFVR